MTKTDEKNGIRGQPVARLQAKVEVCTRAQHFDPSYSVQEEHLVTLFADLHNNVPWRVDARLKVLGHQSEERFAAATEERHFG